MILTNFIILHECLFRLGVQFKIGAPGHTREKCRMSYLGETKITIFGGNDPPIVGEWVKLSEQVLIQTYYHD